MQGMSFEPELQRVDQWLGGQAGGVGVAKFYGHNRCRTCVYRAADCCENGCDYIVLVGQSRGCPLGDQCIRYKEGPRMKIETGILLEDNDRELREVDNYRRSRSIRNGYGENPRHNWEWGR